MILQQAPLHLAHSDEVNDLATSGQWSLVAVVNGGIIEVRIHRATTVMADSIDESHFPHFPSPFFDLSQS